MKLLEWMKTKRIAPDSEALEQLAGPQLEAMAQVDAENRDWLKKTVGKKGWPGKTLVGPDGAQAAFLLVQHADKDLPFQKRCLKLMQRAPKGDVAPTSVAYLTDRVRLAEGKKQLYGTQVERQDGRWQVRPVEDPAKLDERRQSVGLPPIADYLQLVVKMYTPAKAKPE